MHCFSQFADHKYCSIRCKIVGNPPPTRHKYINSIRLRDYEMLCVRVSAVACAQFIATFHPWDFRCKSKTRLNETRSHVSSSHDAYAGIIKIYNWKMYTNDTEYGMGHHLWFMVMPTYLCVCFSSTYIYFSLQHALEKLVFLLISLFILPKNVCLYIEYVANQIKSHGPWFGNAYVAGSSCSDRE